jgi:hypothetical protein
VAPPFQPARAAEALGVSRIMQALLVGLLRQQTLLLGLLFQQTLLLGLLHRSRHGLGLLGYQ